jgi:hypothetical protein
MGGGGKGGGKGRGQDSNVLLASIEEMTYPVTIEVDPKPSVPEQNAATARRGEGVADSAHHFAVARRYVV